VLALDLVPVPGGTLRAGAPVERVRADVQAHADLGIPWHYFSKETGDASFEIADLRVQRCPMTWGELRALLPDVEAAVRTAEESPRHPVDRLSWETAQRVAARAAELLARPLRLLTEWEWEHVARGGDDRVYPWGDVYEASRCNLAEAGCGGTRPVGSFPSGASRHGVLDLAGNVDEWTSSLYAPLPGAHWSVPLRELWSADPHVTRGGSFAHHRDLARTRRRHGLYRPWVGAGLRLVLEASP
jgi:toxoflavin biosynthesis protein ToxD